MQRLQIKREDITEEKISDLVKFLDSGIVPEGWTESKLAVFYGQLKSKGNKLDKAEEWLKPFFDKKKESYKWRIINEIKKGIEEMRNETGGVGHYEYEIVNIKNRGDGRTMQIGFRDIDNEGKTKRKKSVLIEEKDNPDFFQEMMNKYAPHLQPKPF